MESERKKLYDSHRRPINSLRLSVNRECNLGCFYCHNEGIPYEKTLMEPEEIERIVQVASNLGIGKVKITGGEPLLRDDIVDIVRKISPHVFEVSLTTNAIRLAHLAGPLKDAGLNRVNISLHTIRPSTYKKICRYDKLPEALRGLDAAKSAQLDPIKINMVLLRGLNEHEIPEMLEFAARRDAILQLIEFETDRERLNGNLFVEHHLDMTETRRWLLKTGKIIGTNPLHSREKLLIERLPGGIALTKPVIVELVMPMHNTKFCANCTRIRLTPGGFIKGCLFERENVVNILDEVRRGADDCELEKHFLKVIERRKPYWGVDEDTCIRHNIGGEIK
jgi:cyclic pyranopterin phosphate synthase